MSAALLKLLHKYPHHVGKLIARTTLYIVAFYVSEVGTNGSLLWYLKVIVIPVLP